MRTFDLKQQFEEIKKSATEAVKSIFPVEGRLRSIKLDDIFIDDKLDTTDYTSQSKAKASNGTWGVPVYASLSLYEKASGKLIDRNPKVRLFLLPKITPRFSYIVSGNEYQINNQLRLKSGVYTIRKQNGELKTMVNLSQGKNFDLMFDEHKGIFTIAKVGGGQANIPLYHILTHMGISHQAIEKTLGPEIANLNKATDMKAVARASSAFGVKSGELKDYFAKTKLGGEVTKITLGKGYDTVSGEMLLSAAKKLLDVHLGKQEAEDRDSLKFKEIHSLEDFIKERLEKNKESLAFKIKRSIDSPKRDKISQIVNPGAFNSVVESFFTQDDKSATPEQTNPLEMLSGQYRATIMGSGGIKSNHAITDAMRNIHPTHYGFIDPVNTPESEKIGANLHIPLGAIKDGKELKSIFLDKSGKPKALTATEAFNSKIAFPNQKGPSYKVNFKGQTIEVPKSEVDYFTPSSRGLFSWSTNLIPYLPSNQGNRAMMAAKQLEQAISLKHREEPLVQVGAGTLGTMEKTIGKQAAVTAPEDGVIKSITKDFLTLKTKTGDIKIGLYNHFSLNRKSYLHHEPVVKVGDRVRKGQLLADSNFTKNGTLALGANFRTTYLPYQGANFEDGVVVTESAAEKLTSVHIHKKSADIDDNTILKLATFRTQYPNALTPENLKKLDEDGVIKKGQTVKMGEAVIATLQKRVQSGAIGVIQRQLADRPKDTSSHWNLEEDGEVIDVQKSGKTVTVFIRTEEKAKIGDKLSGRMGNKGIITRIIPDNEAPRNTKGEPVEVLLNPHGVISRINIGQIYESAAAKAAKKSGKPVVIENFSGEDYLDSTKKLLKDHGIDDKEELFDPKTGKSLGKVHVGNPYLLKLFKLSQGNFSVRQGGPGNPYDINLQPLKAGGDESAKSLDLLTMYSMLSHGARANLREMSTLKSNQNDEFWKALKSGQTLPPPESPFVYDKFIAYLRGAGIDVKKSGTKLTLAPLTDKEVKNLSSGEVDKPVFYRSKDMEPIKGGFLDPVKFGGFKGKKWGHIELKEPIVNPVFEDAVKKITGLGGKYDEIISGKLFVSSSGEFNKEGKGVTGGAAIEKILKSIDVDTDLAALTKKSKLAKGAVLDDINKKIRYLSALKKYNLKPHDAYIRRTIAVVPPIYRPIYTLPDGNITTSDSNVLYQNIGVLNTLQKLPVYDLLPEDDKAALRADIQEHARGVSGLTDLNIKGRERSGFISEIKGGAGGQPKEGFFISKMLGKRQDFVGRGTIIPEPTLGIDEVALPEQMAWKLFEPFIVRELSRFGKSPNQALDEIKSKTQLAQKALEIVLKNRKVLLNRAPSLHKFSIMAFRPQITSGTAIKIPPLVTRGFNADFNGDSVVRQTLIVVEYFDEKENTYSMLCDTIENIFCQITGKTVEEMVFDAKGYTAIYELPENRLKTIGIVNGKIKKTDIRRLTVHTSHGSCYKIKTHTGTEGIFSEHHNFSYIDSNLDLKCIKTENMPTGVLIPKASLDLAWGDTKFLITNIGTKKILVDEEWAYLLGFYAGDGHSSDRRHTGRGVEVGFTDTEGSVLVRLRNTLENAGFTCGELQGTEKHPKCKLPVYNNALGLWLIDHCGAGFDKKIIPTIIFNSPTSVRLMYIAGVIEAEGNICTDGFGNNLIRLEMNNDVFIRQLRILMESCGISSYWRETLGTEKQHKAYLLQICKSSWEKLECMPGGVKGDLVKTAIAKRAKNIKVSREVYDVVPFSPDLLKEFSRIGKKCVRLTKQNKANIAMWRERNPGRKVNFNDHFKNKKNPLYVSRTTAFDLVHTYGYFAEEASLLNKWIAIVKDTSIKWELIEALDPTKRENVLFDFTVPEGETFCIDNGLITHNTMTVHAPITDEANFEAEKMLPSKNLFQPGTGKLMISPSQEAQIGIFYLSKTQEGRKQLDKILGKKFSVNTVLDKKATGELLSKLSKELKSNEFAAVVNALKSAGEAHAFDRGFTLGLDDIHVLKKERTHVVNKIQQMANKASPDRMLGISDAANKLVDSLISRKLKGKNNPLFDMVESGARGDPSQLRAILSTPMFVADSKGRIVPHAIKKSYAEGLDIGDYWTSMYGARKGMMDRAIQTSLPGAFSKDIMANTIDNVISAVDCGTKKGVSMRTDSPDVLDRFTAGAQGSIPHNTLVDQKVLTKLKASGLKVITVRSPLTCLQAKGVCAKCYGLDEHGQIPSVGENVGAKAGQTISEPLTQLVMNSFHTGGAAGTGADIAGYKRIDQLLKLPKIVSGSASLAPSPGKITRLEAGIAGGYDVWVGEQKIHIAQGLTPKVKVGDMVAAGDPLSTGVIKPQDLVKYKGMQPAQEYIVDELKKAYGSQKVGIQRKIFETVVRSFGNTTQVLNQPKGTPHLPGDIIPYTLARNHNENLFKKVPIDEAVGYMLARSYGPIKAGQEIGEKEIKLLKATGHKDIEVKSEAIEHAPMLKSITALPILRKNWMSSLGYRGLAKALTEGAGQAWETDLEDYHPVPAFAHGTTFGKGKNGKY